MSDIIQAVRESYDSNAEYEWERLERHPIEFELTKRYFDRYISAGDTVLDIGGGPGRYSLYLAERGCNVTLFDLSEQNIRAAERRASEKGINIATICGDAREADKLVTGSYDHVLLMGPMYHLLEESDRKQAVEAGLRLLKPGGCFFVSFISVIAGIHYGLKSEPEFLLSQDPEIVKCCQAFLAGESVAAHTFTYAYFIQPNDALSFMSQFPLEFLHFFGQEGVCAPGEPKIIEAGQEVIEAWVNLSEKVCERPESLCLSEHLMYIGRKPKD